MDTPQFRLDIHLTDIWMFLLWGYYKKMIMIICVQDIVWMYVLIFLRYIPRSEIAVLYDNFMFTNLKN